MTARRRVEGAHEAPGGWWFKRGDGGVVTVWCGSNGAEDGPEQVFDAAGWARIVAAMTPAGETRRTYRAALALHEGTAP